MTTYEPMMFDDPIFETAKDTEMAVDAMKYPQRPDEIEIDLDFTDHGNQDAMMTEEQHSLEYDMDLGDVNAQAEQDAEMTDESAEDEMFDEEIVDAPVEETQLNEENAASKDSTALAQLSMTNAANAVSGAQTVSVIQSTSVASDILQPEIRDPEVNGESGATEGTAGVDDLVEEEIEELITWESDSEEEEKEEEEEKIEKKDTAESNEQTKVGEEVSGISQITTNLQDAKEHSQAQSAIGGETHDDKRSDSAVGIPEQDNLGFLEQPTKNSSTDAPKTLANTLLDTGENSYVEHEDESDLRVPSDLDDDEVEEFAELAPQLETINDATLEQLHPIVVRYMDQEMSLFPPTIEEEHNVFLLGNKKLAFDNCETLFKAFRTVLGDSLAEHESLLLDCPDLGLEIHEGIPECSTLSIAQLLHLHLGLSHNDGHEQAGPLNIVLKHHQDLSSRLNQLYALLNDGKGLTSLESTDTDGQMISNELAGDDEEEHQIGYDAVPADGHAELKDIGNEASAQVEAGYSTPRHNGLLQANIDNEELDFSSPNVTDKGAKDIQSAKHPEVTRDNSKRKHVADPQQPNGEKIVNETAWEDDEITYDDGEEEVGDEAEVVEQGQTGLFVSANTEDVSSADLLDATTNNARNETSTTNYSLEKHTTETSDESSGHTVIEDGEDSYNENEPDRTALQSSGPNGEINNAKDVVTGKYPSPSQSAVADDDFEEIDYSDDDDPPAPAETETDEVPNVLQKSSSPKRAIEEADEPERDVKKLRSA